MFVNNNFSCVTNFCAAKLVAVSQVVESVDFSRAVFEIFMRPFHVKCAEKGIVSILHELIDNSSKIILHL